MEMQADLKGQSPDVDNVSISDTKAKDEEKLLESSYESTMHQLNKLTIKVAHTRKLLSSAN